MRRELGRLRSHPNIHTRVCTRCEGTVFRFEDEPHNPLSRRTHRRCARCGNGSTALTNGDGPYFLYGGGFLTNHLNYFGVAEGYLIFGIATAWGFCEGREEWNLKRLLLG